MPAWLILALILFAAWILWRRYQRVMQAKRERFIAGYDFAPALVEKFRQTRSGLDPTQEQKVFDGLREYFQVCNMAGRRMVSMPSQAVDDAWHNLILFTRTYDLFCRKAFGRFLHHTPAEAMTSPTRAQDGIKRAWRLCCKREGIDPRKPTHLPLLFAIDSELGIADGFHYDLHCNAKNRDNYCASHIGCGGGCSSGCGGDSGGSSCSSGCGGGCGGD